MVIKFLIYERALVPRLADLSNMEKVRVENSCSDDSHIDGMINPI